MLWHRQAVLAACGLSLVVLQPCGMPVTLVQSQRCMLGIVMQKLLQVGHQKALSFSTAADAQFAERSISPWETRRTGKVQNRKLHNCKQSSTSLHFTDTKGEVIAAEAHHGAGPIICTPSQVFVSSLLYGPQEGVRHTCHLPYHGRTHRCQVNSSRDTSASPIQMMIGSAVAIKPQLILKKQVWRESNFTVDAS